MSFNNCLNSTSMFFSKEEDRSRDPRARVRKYSEIKQADPSSLAPKAPKHDGPLRQVF